MVSFGVRVNIVVGHIRPGNNKACEACLFLTCQGSIDTTREPAGLFLMAVYRIFSRSGAVTFKPDPQP